MEEKTNDEKGEGEKGSFDWLEVGSSGMGMGKVPRLSEVKKKKKAFSNW